MTLEQFAVQSTLNSYNKRWDGMFSFSPPEKNHKLYKAILANIREYNPYKLYGLKIVDFWYNTKTGEMFVSPYAQGQDLTNYKIDPETLEVWQ